MTGGDIVILAIFDRRNGVIEARTRHEDMVHSKSAQQVGNTDASLGQAVNAKCFLSYVLPGHAVGVGWFAVGPLVCQLLF